MDSCALFKEFSVQKGSIKSNASQAVSDDDDNRGGSGVGELTRAEPPRFFQPGSPPSFILSPGSFRKIWSLLLYINSMRKLLKIF